MRGRKAVNQQTSSWLCTSTSFVAAQGQERKGEILETFTPHSAALKIAPPPSPGRRLKVFRHNIRDAGSVFIPQYDQGVRCSEAQHVDSVRVKDDRVAVRLLLLHIEITHSRGLCKAEYSRTVSLANNGLIKGWSTDAHLWSATETDISSETAVGSMNTMQPLA